MRSVKRRRKLRSDMWAWAAIRATVSGSASEASIHCCTAAIVSSAGGTVLASVGFAEAYAADLDPAEAAIMAAAQKPFDPTTLGGSFTAPATWPTLPSWSVICTSDVSIPTQTLRWMAERAGSTVTEVDSSHAVPVAHPDVVASVILAAAGIGQHGRAPSLT